MQLIFRPVALALLMLGLLAGCAVTEIRPQKAPGTFAWFDLVTDAPEAARGFYGPLFGWSFRPGGTQDYELITMDNLLIGGMTEVEDSDPNSPVSQWVPALSVEDVFESARIARKNGARLESPLIKSTAGQFALIRDATSAPLTLYDGQDGFVLEAAGTENGWVWADLFTDRPQTARRFYSALAGFETRKARSASGEAMEIFTLGGEDRGGLVRVRRSDIEPNWLPYVAVSDLDATIAKARQLGGRLLSAEAGVAIIIDPTGAAIGLAERGEMAQ